MQITITHNSELRLHKVDALHRMYGVSYPVSGDNHHPSIGEEVEVAKHGGHHYTDKDSLLALARLTQGLTDFRASNHHKDLTTVVNTLEAQDTLF